MNGEDLQKVIAKFLSIRDNFLGVFSIDSLPKIFPVNHFLICNYDLKSMPGSHWFALVRKSNERIECFDSLSLNNDKKELLIKYCNFDKATKIIYNETPVQKITSLTCGQFVLFFLIHRIHNLDESFVSILNEIFNSNTENNEESVLNFLLDFN